MSQTYLLYRLQQTDNAIREKKQRLNEVVQAQQQNEALLVARRQKKQAEQALQSARGRQKELELELGTVGEKARRSEERLYSGLVTNTKELTDLQQEVEGLGRRRSVLEDEVLEVMFLTEAAEAEYETARVELQRVETMWEERLTALQEEQETLVRDLRELMRARDEQTEHISQKVLAIYQATGQRRGGVAVATLKDGSCQACRVRVSGKVAQTARADELAYCGSCGRILHPV